MQPTSTTTADNDHLRAVARGGSWNLIGAAVNVVLSLGVVVVVARGFSVDVAGIFWAAVSLFLILDAVGRLGADVGVTYFIPRLRSAGRRSDIREVLRHALSAVVVAATATGALLVWLAPWVGRHLLGAGSSADAVAVLRVLGVMLPVATAYDVVQAATRGFGSMRPTVLVDKIERPLLQSVLICVVIASGAGAAALAAAWATPFVPALLVTWLFLRRQMKRDAAGHHERAGTRPRCEPPPTPPGEASRDARDRTGPGVGREFWVYTAPRALATAFQVATQRLSTVIIAAMLGPPAAAVFAAVSRLLVLGQMAVVAVQQAMAPKISDLLGREESAATRVVYQASTAWLILVSWPVYLLLAVQGAPALSVLGHVYAKHAEVLSLLAVGMLYSAACGPVDVLLLMAGQSKRSLLNRFLALVAMVAVSLALVPPLGLNGAAIGWVASLVVANTAALVQVKILLDLHPFGQATIWAIWVTLACFGGVPLLALVAIGPGITGLLLSVTVGGLVYFAILWRRRSMFQLDLLVASLRRRPANRAILSG
ncbi:MAG: lipopolysaccharide biosynthesis protein [Frankiaceae bacterium]